jgi:UPF0042 nucleotide-binding protein
MTEQTDKNLLFVTGLSGAGLSSVLKYLEDLGYEVFDNFPLSLIDPLVQESAPAKNRIAIGIDARTRGFSPQALIEKSHKHKAQILFITCDANILRRRFTETRRKHPLAKTQPIVQGIEEERSLLSPLQQEADLVIDTTKLSVHDLRHVLEGHFQTPAQDKMVISLISFGFRNGLPRQADIVMDVRFLKNPHWDSALKPQSGLDKPVQDYIDQDPDFRYFIDSFTDLMHNLLPKYKKEGKNYLTIAIGCTGGRHRSVFAVESLKHWMEESGYFVSSEHRDLKL